MRIYLCDLIIVVSFLQLHFWLSFFPMPSPSPSLSQALFSHSSFIPAFVPLHVMRFTCSRLSLWRSWHLEFIQNNIIIDFPYNGIVTYSNCNKLFRFRFRNIMKLYDYCCIYFGFDFAGTFAIGKQWLEWMKVVVVFRRNSVDGKTQNSHWTLLGSCHKYNQYENVN